eukprot:UN09925
MKRKIGFNDCRLVVVESILDKILVRGSGTLIEHPSLWGESKNSGNTIFESLAQSIPSLFRRWLIISRREFRIGILDQGGKEFCQYFHTRIAFASIEKNHLLL